MLRYFALVLLVTSVTASRVGSDERSDVVGSENQSSPQPVHKLWRLAFGRENLQTDAGAPRRHYGFGCEPEKPCCMCRDDSSVMWSDCYSPAVQERSQNAKPRRRWAKAGEDTGYLCCEWIHPPKVHSIVKTQNYAALNSEDYDNRARDSRSTTEMHALWSMSEQAKRNVTKVGAKCFGLTENVCTVSQGKPVYMKAIGEGRIWELLQMSATSIQHAFARMAAYVGKAAKDAWDSLTLENLAKKGQQLQAYLYKLVTTREGWWTILKVSAKITLVAITLACTACAAGVVIAGLAWGIAKAAIDNIIEFKKDQVSAVRAAVGFLVGVVSATASMMTFVHIDPLDFMSFLSHGDTAFSFLLAICESVSQGKEEPEDNIQVSINHLNLDELSEEEQDEVNDALAASKDPDVEVVTCGRIRQAQRKAVAVSTDGEEDCDQMWAYLN